MTATLTGIDELLASRKQFVQVVPVQNDWGSWDVAILIDGHYSERDDAEQVAEWVAGLIKGGEES